MLHEKKKFILIIVLMCSTACFSQINYGLKLNYGLSNLNVVDKEPRVKMSGYYEALPLYVIHTFISENIRDSKYSFEQGIAFESSSSEFNMAKNAIKYMKEHYPDSIFSTCWNDRNYQLTIPLSLRYRIKPWLYIVTGIDNVFYLSEKNYEINRRYTLRGRIETQAILNKRFIVGLKGTYDITPSGQVLSKERIYYKYYTASLSFGILLSNK